MLVFGWACFLSTVFEYFRLSIFRKRSAFRNLALCVIIANLSGYIVMWVTLLMFSHFPWLNTHFRTLILTKSVTLEQATAP